VAHLDTPVLIVGGGPVGLFLAMELGSRNIDCLLVNERPSTSTHPKGSTLNARTMEHLRRLGAARDVRAVGVPADHVTDITYITRFTGYELGRIEMPSLNEKIGNPGPWGETLLTPEPIHRCNQIYFEPVLRRWAESYPSTDIRFGWRLNSFRQFADRVDAEIENLATGEKHSVSSRYLVACDGANGLVRRQLGFKYGGRESSGDKFYDGRMLSLYVRAPKIYDVMNFPVSWHYLTVNSDGRMDCISLDCRGDFVILAHIPADLDLEQFDSQAFFHRAVGRDIGAEIISVEEWWAGLALVTDHYQSGRVFLAGDSVHLFTPTGGFGFNTGIDDSVNLAWKLAAVIDGWGGARLLETYEAERRPIGIRNTTESGNLAEQIANLQIPLHLEEDSPRGAAERKAFGELIEIFREEFASLGIQLGARYDGSRIVAPDNERPPPDNPKTYTPSSVPGGRAPHYWINDTDSLFDRFGPGFTLLSAGPDAPDAAALSAAAEARGVPITVAEVTDPGVERLYPRKLALIRPDQHLAWRGDVPPDDPDRLWDLVTGRG